MDKYVTSKIDGKLYCRKNGQFFKHLKKYGYDYHTYFITFLGEKELCPYCGDEKSFRPHQMVYYSTCGKSKCRGRMISSVKQSFTDEKWQHQLERYRATMAVKTEEELIDITRRRKQSSNYQVQKEKRRKTCFKLYGDETYNNPQQITKTKLEWDEERKNLFLTRLKRALGGKWMSDFHTEESFRKRRKLLEERGDITPWEQLTEWQQYLRAARTLSDRNYRKYKHIVNPFNFKRGNKHYHLDHIIPIFYGFMNNIPIPIIASVENLQMLPDIENRKKAHRYEPKTISS